MRSPQFIAPVLGLAFAATVLAAQPTVAAPAATLAGHYSYQAGDSDDVEKAINAAVDQVNFVIRGIARGRLTATNKPYQTVDIAYSDKEVTITTDGRAPLVTPAAGSPIKWKREDGELFDLSTRWDKTALVQTFKAADGQRENRYQLSPDGRKMTMAVTVTSSKLPKPLTYKLGYNKK